MTLPADTPQGYLRCAEAVTLSPGEDMAVLLLLKPSCETARFYLDKPVALLPGQCFAVLPAGNQCTVLWKADAPLEPVETITPPACPSMLPSVVLEQLYTAFEQSHPPGFFFAGERHQPYELVYICQGVLHNLVGGQDYILHTNEALVIPPDKWHAQYGMADQPVRFITVSFSCRKPLPEKLLLRVLPEQQTTTEQIRSILHDMSEQCDCSNDLLLSGVQLLLARYASRQSNRREGPSPASLRNENQILDHALEYIAGHIYERITVGTLAKHCSVSTAYLSLLFGRHLHVSPAAYVLHARLEESCYLLRSGSMAMGQIAAQLCFSSPQHFSSAFKRQYGMTPSAYAHGVLR